MGWRIFSLTSLAFAQLLAAAPSFADPPNEAVKMARRRFQEGVAAVDAGNYEAARVAFQQAYALKPHPSVLRNLGQAELKTGRHLEAARHLATFVRDTTYGTAAERDAASKSLAQAESQVGKLTIEVDVAGAEVTVDGELAGRTPIVDPFYAESGDRVILIRKEGYEAYERTHLIEPGRTTQLKIKLDWVRVATPAASVSKIAGSIEAPLREIETTPTASVGPPPAGLVPTPEPKTHGRTIALAATGGLALVSAGVWLGFGLHGITLQHEADDLLRQVNAAHPATGCERGEPPCDELRRVSDRRATANTFALVGAISTGVSAGAFAATFFLWPKSHAGVARTLVLPALTGESSGVEVRGFF